MAALRIWYRTLGIGWILIGLVVIIFVAVYLLTTSLLENALLSLLPLPVIEALERATGITTGFSIGLLWVLLFGIFCILLGVGLVTLRGWARTIGVAFHFTIGAFFLGLAVVVYSWLSGLPADILSLIAEEIPAIILVSGIILALIVLSIGYQMSTPAAMDAFFQFTLIPPPPPPVCCPTCNGPLDLSNARCPHCDIERQSALPIRARLVTLDESRSYQVSLQQTTYIGRANPAYDIRIDDPTVSQEHAYIEYIDGRFILHALRDTNGTFVNDRKVRDVELRNQDLVAFGQVCFRFAVE